MSVYVFYHAPAENMIETLTGPDYLNETFLIGRFDIELKSHADPDRPFI